MARVGFVLKRDKEEAVALARDLAPWLMGQGHQVVLATEHAGLAAGVVAVAEAELPDRIDLLVVLGGDGTLLHGAGVVGERDVPLLGINLGRLGFLAPFAPAEAREAVTAALAGRLPVEERERLEVALHRDGKVSERGLALNDVVVSQASMARLMDLAVTMDGTHVVTYRADGLIICTPTGSTAYNLAAGGPILVPGQDAMVVTPICPHSLTNRPLVAPATALVGVEVVEAQKVLLTRDGQWVWELKTGDRLTVSASAARLRLYRSQKSYFEILREKLRWGEREP